MRLGLVGAAALALPVVWGGSAFADYQPQPGDIVGVGGDTPQFAVDFALNGYTNGVQGLDSSAAVNRVINFDATADGNARNAYAQGSTEGSPIPLNPTDVLRAGSYPVQRVQSSGAAITALLADYEATPTHPSQEDPTYVNKIDFVASASLPTSAQETTAVSHGWGGLHDVQIANDNIEVAANGSGNGGTNAPAGLTVTQLVSIYSAPSPGITWSALTSGADPSTTIVYPELPPSGSSVYKTFVKALNHAYNGTTGTSTFAFTKSPEVTTIEQNDPTAITGAGATNKLNAIVPFAAGRLSLWNAGFFHTPGTVFPGGSALSPNIQLLTGTPDGGGASYVTAIHDYIIFRQSDLSDATAYNPGSALNWAHYLFSSTGEGSPVTPEFAKSSIGTLIGYAGVTYNYVDLGLA
jgi:hypothetical protein